DNVVALIRDRGLPHRRIEAWKYTDLRTVLGEVPALAARPEDEDATKAAISYNRFTDAVRLPFFNGHYFSELADDLPEGVSVSEYAVAHSNATATDAPITTDAIALFDQAFGGTGLSIDVIPNATITKPVGFANVIVGDVPVLAATRHAVTVGNNATATFIERHVGPAGLAYMTNALINLTLGEGAKVHWVIVQEEGDAARHLSQLNITLAANADLNISVLNAGGALVRREIHIDVAGAGSNLTISGVNLIGGDAHIDVTTTLNHREPDTTASEIFRNVVTNNGTGVFQGRINVAAKAQKTDAQMACNTLLLSEAASFSAKPELEIFADDVVCGHGATCGQIDEDMLFFLRSRGIPQQEAEQMMVMAFLSEVIGRVDDDPIRNALDARIRDWIGLPPEVSANE
ncbi:MAG: Fe-S cluster assembly protein SufD, partial [Alphaproteobacteria bacterium]